MPIIYTIILCFIGLFVLFIIYDNYLDTTSKQEYIQYVKKENFETPTEVAEEEAKEDLEEQEIPNVVDDSLLPGEKTEEENEAIDKARIMSMGQAQEVEELVEPFTDGKKEKAVGLFQSIVNFFTGKKTVEGFAW